MDLNYMTSELLCSAFTIHNSKTEQHAIKLIGDYDIVAAAVCRCLHHPICWGQHLPPQSKTVSFQWGTDWMLKFIIMPLRCEISFWRANSLSWGQHHQRARNATKTHQFLHGCNLSCWHQETHWTSCSLDSYHLLVLKMILLCFDELAWSRQKCSQDKYGHCDLAL